MDPIKLLTEQLGQAQQQQKTFSDRLRERRSFVQGQENTAAPIFERLLEAPGGEARVSAGDIINPLRGFTTENTRNIQAAEADLDRVTGRSDNLLNTLIQLSESQKGRQLQQSQFEREMGLKERQLALEEARSQAGGNLEDLLALRKTAKDQGLDTATIDAELEGLGISPSEESVKGKQEIVTLIDELLGSPTESITGIRGLIPDIPGTRAAQAGNTFEHLKAKLSLDNVEKLKGQGQISDKEREMLQKAATKLSKNLSNKEFRRELERMRSSLGGGSRSGNSSNLNDQILKDFGL